LGARIVIQPVPEGGDGGEAGGSGLATLAAEVPHYPEEIAVVVETLHALDLEGAIELLEEHLLPFEDVSRLVLDDGQALGVVQRVGGGGALKGNWPSSESLASL